VPAYDVLREFIGGCLLPYWQFSVDEPVLVNVPLRLIEDKQLNAQHLPEYYEVPCFGVPWINGAIDSNKLISLSWVKGSKNRKNKVDICRITLFDTWLENADRHGGNHNMLMRPKDTAYDIVPIDHGMLFQCMDFGEYAKLEGIYAVTRHLLVSDIGHKIKQSLKIDAEFVQSEKEYFYLCIDRCSEVYSNIVDFIVPHYPINREELDDLGLKLFDKERNKKVFDEYVSKLK
jgi:hypothetical protein